MGGSDLVELGPILSAAAVQALVTLGLHAWGRWVAARQGGRWWRRASWMPLLGLVLALLGIGTTVVLLVQAFGALSGVDAADRASALSDGIARAMVATAATAPVSALLYLASLIVFTVGSVRRPTSGAKRVETERSGGTPGSAP
jgi:protein-S-isoprenylcysteine O-methyltransferase Ste14